jgi:Inosine-uridine preferring nucleoside hydrolase
MIIDVDPGIDDAMAIFYAVRRPGMKLEALTTTFGNTDTAIATDNALRMLELLGRPDIPVAKGVGRSFIHRCVRRADHVHGSNAIGDIELPEPKIRPTDEHASDLIIRMAKESPGEITLCRRGDYAAAIIKETVCPNRQERRADLPIKGLESFTVSIPRSLSSVFSGDFGISIPAAGRCSPSWQQSPSDVVCGARRRRIGHCVGDLHYRRFDQPLFRGLRGQPCAARRCAESRRGGGGPRRAAIASSGLHRREWRPEEIKEAATGAFALPRSAFSLARKRQ